LFAAIINIADAFDAMTSDRPYRKALSEEDALREIKGMSGIQFRPDFVAIFLDLMKESRVHDAPLVVVKAA
jgi:HD-GYP domain-containing protein (c-di-GMP phosphodiesterase class II)